MAAALSQLEPSKEPEADGDQNGTDLVRTGFLPAGAESVMSDIKAYTERAQKYVNASVVAHQNGTGAATSFFLNPNVMLRVQSLPILDNLVGSLHSQQSFLEFSILMSSCLVHSDLDSDRAMSSPGPRVAT